MAGDWIKMRSDLFTHPKVVRISSALKTDTLRTVGGLMSVWCLFDAHSVDGQLSGYTPEVLDLHLRWDGFSNAMISVGWLIFHDKNGMFLPRFDTHNGQSAKRRAQDADRKREVRKVSADEPDKKRTREEKRREDTYTSTDKLLPCQTQDVIDAYHEALPEFPRVQVLNDSRKRAISKFWKFVLTTKKSDGSPRATNAAEALEWIGSYFNRVRDNAFLMGKIGRVGEHSGWKCDLDYLLTDKGISQVIEKTEARAA